VLGLIYQGRADKEIAASLDTSDGTARVYVFKIFQKLRRHGVPIKNRTQCAVWYARALDSNVFSVAEASARFNTPNSDIINA
jgi:DNA-binding NarL/FixJ family response regulator